MSRRSLIVAWASPLLVLGLGGLLLFMLRYEPAHYRQAVVSGGDAAPTVEGLLASLLELLERHPE